MAFNDILGQTTAVEQLLRAIRSNRVAHAYLFHGPPGVGKEAAAWALAQALNCQEPQRGEACGQCPSCRKLIHGNHPDVYKLEPEGAFLKIDQIRDLQKKAYLQNYEGRYKIFILKDVHKLRGPAANALLKILEEPPGQEIMILLTPRIHSILPTILSRCQPIAFHPVAPSLIARRLTEKYQVSPAQAAVIASLAEGSWGKAEALMASSSVAALRERAVDLVEDLGSLDRERIFKLAEDWDKQKEELNQFLDYLALWFRDLMVWKATGKADLLANQDRLSVIAQNRWSQKNMGEALTAVLEAQKQIGQQVNTRLALEGLFLTLKKLA